MQPSAVGVAQALLRRSQKGSVYVVMYVHTCSFWVRYISSSAFPAIIGNVLYNVILQRRGEPTKYYCVLNISHYFISLDLAKGKYGGVTNTVHY
jgi:hypothetical protein